MNSILDSEQFYITKLDDEWYIFYNPFIHFACKVSKVDLAIFNAIYNHKNIDAMLQSIDPRYHQYVSNVFEAVNKSNALVTETDEDDAITVCPTDYYLHLTYRCNLDCLYCYNKSQRTNFKEMSLDDWKAILDKTFPYAKRFVLTGGEPFLCKNIFSIIEYIKKNSDASIEIISNCMTDFMSYEYPDVFKLIDSITFSCDSLSSTHQDRKNFNPELFKTNIHFLRKTFPHLRITISSVSTCNNQLEIQEIHQLTLSEGTNFRSVLVVPNSEEEMYLMPSLTEYTHSLKFSTGNLPSKRKFCGALIGVMSIDPMGNVFPCQSLHFKEFSFGNLKTQDIKEIIEDERVKAFRHNINVDHMQGCSNCKIKYICGGGCRAAGLKLTGNICGINSTLCSYYKAKASVQLQNIPRL